MCRVSQVIAPTLLSLQVAARLVTNVVMSNSSPPQTIKGSSSKKLLMKLIIIFKILNKSIENVFENELTF